MQIITTVADLNSWRKNLGNQDSLGFVPTMGNLHQGHMTLVSQAKKQCQHVIVSIFVNPTQFGPNEDYDSYPRTIDADQALLEKAGIDILFTPDVSDMYPLGTSRFSVTVPEAMENRLCGKNRPGHFQGVATVVSKLFNMTQPTDAYFGKKDYQQLAIIKSMVADFGFPVSIHGVDTVREDSGLAKSSRNGNLADSERLLAPELYKSLQNCVDAIQGGDKAFSRLQEKFFQHIDSKGFIVDYFEICAAESLAFATAGDKKILVAVAAKIGKTRLIDNIVFEIV